MGHRQAKALSADDQSRVLAFLKAQGGRLEARDTLLALTSWKAGLRACEMAGLTYGDILNADGTVAGFIQVATSKGSTPRRNVPMHQALVAPMQQRVRYAFNRGLKPEAKLFDMKPNAIAARLADIYQACGLIGCSSHSGRRSFITSAARNVAAVGGSIEDVRALAGHARLSTTQGYVEHLDERMKTLVNMA